ncbi:MAG: hypothetical protein MMC33_004250 [Icmadophila ericetorum]|nr:hypothetical protein [Icmadophila ericetorum]
MCHADLPDVQFIDMQCVSAPARASKRDQEQVDEAKRLSLQTPAASVGAAGHVNGAETALSPGNGASGDIVSPVGDSAKRPLHKKFIVADDGASAEHKDGRKEEGSPDGFVVHLDGSSPSVPARNERSRTASKKRQLLADSSNDDDGGRRSSSEQSAADESDGEASSDFSGAESESCEDEDSDVADSEDEEEKKDLHVQVKAMAAAPRPKAAQQKSSTAAAQAKSSSAAACRTQASAPVARSGPAAKAQDPSQKRAATKGGAAPLSGESGSLTPAAYTSCADQAHHQEYVHSPDNA